jgi:hypothetical protein
MMAGSLISGFAGFSFEKTHLTDGFFTGANRPLIALFRLLGPGIVRIGANDSDNATWVPTAAPVPGGRTTLNVGTADVDALADFLAATQWTTIYAVNIRGGTGPAAAEANYAQSKLGSSLHSIEIGNELDLLYGSYATARTNWETVANAIRALSPNVEFAGPATFSNVNGFTVPFARDEASRVVMLTEHYYRGSAGSANANMATLLAADPGVVTQSTTVTAAAQANNIRDGWRWDEMNSFSSHGQPGVSDAFGSALWAIDFMLRTAQNGSAGVNFHGGGQNMDGNVCANGPTSCTRPFRYSPILETNSQVAAAAPLFYGMLFVSRAGTGPMLRTTVTAGNLNFSAYTILQSDGSTNLALVNKDSANGINAVVDLGAAVTSASALYLEAPALTSTTQVTFGGAGVTAAGAWNPGPPFALPVNGNSVTVLVPPASAVLVHAH